VTAAARAAPTMPRNIRDFRFMEIISVLTARRGRAGGLVSWVKTKQSMIIVHTERVLYQHHQRRAESRWPLGLQALPVLVWGPRPYGRHCGSAGVNAELICEIAIALGYRRY
jgi:hypothetical protein